MSKNRKTRQEKIIADLRKKLASTQQPLINTIDHLKERKPISETNLPIREISYKSKPVTSPVSSEKPILPTSPTLSLDYSYAYRDLRKTLALAVLAISAELVLYSIWR
jgi:hypothetical protein